MLEHVLVPLDGSQLAEMALDHAKKLLGTNGKLTLLTVFDLPEYPIYGYYPTPLIVEETDYQTATRDMLPKAKEYLEKMAAPLRDLNFRVDVVAEIGEPATIIVETAQKQHVDAICMSTHGRSGFSRWLFGSVTNKVLTATPCPVYVVPGRKSVKTEEPAQAEVTPVRVKA